MLVDACPIVTSLNGSCCEVNSNAFKFSATSLKSRVYNITNFCGDCEALAEGYCDADVDGGGWLVVQRRQDSSIDFNRRWVEYEEGFGSITGELWYGLRPLHCLTNQGQWRLRIDFTLTNGTKSYMSYNSFLVGLPVSQYQLSISGFTGTTSEDPFYKYPINGIKFTTKDRDNDRASGGNCALCGDGIDTGRWWHNSCTNIHPNHLYKSRYGIAIGGMWYSFQFIEMKIKPINC